MFSTQDGEVLTTSIFHPDGVAYQGDITPASPFPGSIFSNISALLQVSLYILPKQESQGLSFIVGSPKKSGCRPVPENIPSPGPPQPPWPVQLRGTALGPDRCIALGTGPALQTALRDGRTR